MLRATAQIISVVFHPLLILTYSLVMLLFVNPYIFGAHNISERMPIVIMTFMATFFIPAIAVVMMKSLGLVKSIELKDRQDRTVPYIVAALFYTSMTVFIKDSPLSPEPFKIALLGTTIGLYLAFFINIFQKISAHAVGMGGFLALLIIVFNMYSYNTFFIDFLGVRYEVAMLNLVLIAIVIAGAVGTARLLLNAHTSQELYGGYLVGFAAMIFAFKWVV